MKLRIIAAVVLCFASLMTGGVCYAQDVRALSFEETVWDFGGVKEADGPVSHVFRFTNVSDTPIVIERVQSDCGCTTPKYSREPVRPGREGTIEVTFDPADFRGRINRSVTVFSNNGKSRDRLTVRANVAANPRPQEQTHPFALALGVRADMLHVPFSYIALGSVNSMAVSLVNTTDREITVAVDEITGGGRLIAALPEKLLPGEDVEISLAYDLRRITPIYGMISDKVYLSIDGRRCELPITVAAIVVDDFGGQDPSIAAGCVIAPAFFNFGRVKAGESVGTEITISNTGKSPLIIRSVSARPDTSSSLTEGTVIKAGGSLRFSVSLDTAGGAGIKTGGITIIVNEPNYPMREVRVAAEIIE